MNFREYSDETLGCIQAQHFLKFVTRGEQKWGRLLDSGPRRAVIQLMNKLRGYHGSEVVDICLKAIVLEDGSSVFRGIYVQVA